MLKVLIAPMTLATVEGAYREVLRDAGFELVFPGKGRQLVEDELLAALDGIDASLAGSEPYTARVFDAHPRLRVVARVGVGYDAVDVPAATAHGVAVTTTPGANHDSVAEHTFALLLGLSRDLVSQHLGVKAGGWPRGATLPLRGAALGIAGLGRIGKAVALRGEAFGMRLLAYDPFPDHAFAAAHGVTFLPFERLLAESDFLSLHLPFTAETAPRHQPADAGPHEADRLPRQHGPRRPGVRGRPAGGAAGRPAGRRRPGRVRAGAAGRKTAF